jgi:hypothetical protein
MFVSVERACACSLFTSSNITLLFLIALTLNLTTGPAWIYALDLRSLSRDLEISNQYNKMIALPAF